MCIRVVVSRNGDVSRSSPFSLLSLEFLKFFFFRGRFTPQKKKEKCPSTKFLEKATRRRECSYESCPLLRRKRRRERLLLLLLRGRFVRFRGERWEEASFCLLLVIRRRGDFGKASNQRRFPPPREAKFSFAGTSARIGKFPWFCENRRNI